MRAFFPIAYKEALHIWRDPRSLAASLMLPLLLLLLFGYAISFDVRYVPVAIVDHDHSPASRALVDALVADGAVQVVARPHNDAALDLALQDGTARIALVLPAGYGASLAAGEEVPIQLLVDGADASYAGQSLQHVVGVIGAGVRRDIRAVVRTHGGPDEAPGLSTAPRVFFNESLQSRWSIVPALIAVIVSMLAAMVTSQCVAREYETGTIEQILVSRVSGPALMLGKLVPYVGIGIIQVAMVTVAARVLFEVPIRGSLVLLAIGTLLYLIGSMAFGLMLSAVLKSQQVALQVSVVATMLPSLLLSGFIFPITNMPWPLQALSHAVAARYYVVIARGLFLKGTGLDVLWPDFLAMTVFAAVLLLAATSRFRRSLT